MLTLTIKNNLSDTDTYYIRTTLRKTLVNKCEVEYGALDESNGNIRIRPKANRVFSSLNFNKVVSKSGAELNTKRLTKEQALKIVDMFNTFKQLGISFSGSFQKKDGEIDFEVEDMSSDWTEMYNKSSWALTK